MTELPVMKSLVKRPPARVASLVVSDSTNAMWACPAVFVLTMEVELNQKLNGRVSLAIRRSWMSCRTSRSGFSCSPLPQNT